MRANKVAGLRETRAWVDLSLPPTLVRVEVFQVAQQLVAVVGQDVCHTLGLAGVGHKHLHQHSTGSYHAWSLHDASAVATTAVSQGLAGSGQEC